jgi:hypothetical protein
VKNQLKQWQITALLTAQELNWDLQHDAAGCLYVPLAGGKPRYISNGVRGVKLYWGLLGCLPAASTSSCVSREQLLL